MAMALALLLLLGIVAQLFSSSGSPPPEWEGHLLLLLPPSECEDIMLLSPTVLSAYLLRIGPQYSRSLLRILSAPVIIQPSRGESFSSSINLRQMSGAEEISFHQC